VVLLASQVIVQPNAQDNVTLFAMLALLKDVCQFVPPHVHVPQQMAAAALNLMESVTHVQLNVPFHHVRQVLCVLQANVQLNVLENVMLSVKSVLLQDVCHRVQLHVHVPLLMEAVIIAPPSVMPFVLH